ncbi:MAG: redoxin domain-containing protein [Anaerolineales bacterium]|nr:redoxin domain-containing protein [Anaerolineales bacterium]
MTEKNAVVIGISPDGAKSHQKFKTKYNLPFVIVSDEDHGVAEQYGVWAEKSFMGRQYWGNVRSHFIVDEKGVLADVRVDIKPDESVRLALETLK